MYVSTQTCGKDTITYLHDICIINIAILPYYVYRLYHRLTGYVYIESYGEPVDRSKTRKSYTREYKLEVVRFFRYHNLYQTAKRFSLNMKTVGRWVADEEKIQQSKKVSKRVKLLRRCQFPEVKEELYCEYKKLCK